MIHARRVPDGLQEKEVLAHVANVTINQNGELVRSCWDASEFQEDGSDQLRSGRGPRCRTMGPSTNGGGRKQGLDVGGVQEPAAAGSRGR